MLPDDLDAELMSDIVKLTIVDSWQKKDTPPEVIELFRRLGRSVIMYAEPFEPPT